MNAFAFVRMLKSMPHVDANDFEVNKYAIKSRDGYKNEIFNAAISFALSILSVTVLSLIPFAGPFFFLGGLLGGTITAMWLYNAIYAYRHYYDLFTEEDIKKIVDDEATK